jgi:hypothetical protein
MSQQFGSLTNHLDAAGVIGQPTPTVGMGATILHWSDRDPATIVKVENLGKAILLTVQVDKYERTDGNGMSECQSYKFSPNPEGALYTFKQAKNGRWQQVSLNPETGRWNVAKGLGLRIGERDRYYDFSF